MTGLSYRQFTGSAAENYERYFVPAIGRPVSGDLLRAADLQPGERVVDVACGTGLVSRLAATAVGPQGSVTGVDVSPDMIAVAQQTTVDDGAPIEWQVADAQDLPLADESYDVVLCQMGLMFMEDKALALAEMKRVLRDDGRLILNLPGRIQPPFEIMEQAIVRHIDPDLGGFVRVVFSMHDRPTIAALLGSAGFEEVSVVEATTQLRLPAPAEFLWQYINLTPMAPFVQRASEAARGALEQEVVGKWEPYVEGGATIVEQPMLIVGGTLGA